MKSRSLVRFNAQHSNGACSPVSALIVGVALTFSNATAHAEPSELPAQLSYNYGETETPRSTGMGSALHALGTSVDAPFLNPANLGLARVYHIQALGQFTPEASRQAYGVSIVDSTRRVSGGVSLIGSFIDPDGIDRSYIDARLTLSFAISDRFHLGLGGRYLNLEQEGLGPLGNSRSSGGLFDPDDTPTGRLALLNAVTFDAGLTVVLVKGLNIAAFGQNLTYPNNGLLPTLVGGGIGYGTKDFSVEVDGLADLNSWSQVSPRLMAGGEYLIANHFPVRLGYRFDWLDKRISDPSHAVSAGLGYIDPRFSTQASVRRTVTGPGATTIVVSLTYHLESTGRLPISRY